MKADIQKSVTEIIDKSGVEVDTEGRQKIIDEAIETALEHMYAMHVNGLRILSTRLFERSKTGLV